MTLSLRTDRNLIRAEARSTRYLLATFRAPDAAARAQRLPLNTSLILDRSGSMSGHRKFELAREAVEHALRLLQPTDRFSLVVYDTEIDVLASSTLATPDAKRRALDALRGVGPRGSTDLCGGWMRGCEQIAEHLVEEGVTRALLLTDGLANHGETDRNTLARHAGELRRRGVMTSTFGVGDDFDERLLRDMAHEGGGNFYFIDTPAQIPDFLTSELGEALEVVMRGATLTVRAPEGARLEVLNRFRNHLTAHASELRVELGDLVSAQDVRVAVRVQMPRGLIGAHVLAHARLESDGREGTRDDASLEWTFASHADNDHQPRDREVDREVAALYAARARAEATEANRHGDLDASRRVLERTAQRIEGYMGTDAVLRELATSLRSDVAGYAERAMSPHMLKMAMSVAEYGSKGRDIGGRARR